MQSLEVLEARAGSVELEGKSHFSKRFAFMRVFSPLGFSEKQLYLCLVRLLLSRSHSLALRDRYTDVGTNGHSSIIRTIVTRERIRPDAAYL